MTGTEAPIDEPIGRAILAGIDPADQLALVRRAADADRAAGELLHRSVAAARSGGHSWSAIGTVLGLTRQAAQQRFGKEGETGAEAGTADERWLGPVTAFDEMDELALAGRLGWHTVGAGLLRHRMVRTSTQWEHKRVLWSGPLSRFTRDGWELGCRAFPWVYLVRDTGVPVAAE